MIKVILFNLKIKKKELFLIPKSDQSVRTLFK